MTTPHVSTDRGERLSDSTVAESKCRSSTAATQGSDPRRWAFKNADMERATCKPRSTAGTFVPSGHLPRVGAMRRCIAGSALYDECAGSQVHGLRIPCGITARGL